MSTNIEEAMVKVWRGPERRQGVSISEAQLTELVERAAKLAAEQAAKEAAIRAVELIKADFYKGVGKAVVDRMLWVAAALLVAAYIWAKQQGLIK